MVDWIRKSLLILFWFLTFALPLALLFAKPGIAPPGGALVNLYSSAIGVLGEPMARILFCTGWLVVDALLFWRFVLSRRPIDATNVDGLAD